MGAGPPSSPRMGTLSGVPQDGWGTLSGVPQDDYGALGAKLIGSVGAPVWRTLLPTQ